MLRWKVKNYIEENHLCRKSDRLVIGVSGGADSVALLRLLLEMGYRLEAAHCNFQLRGVESERDEQFVRELCKKLAIRLHVRRFETMAYATERKISVEMAARDLRYDWFLKLLQERQAGAIAVAHHQEDNAETVLLNLIRGTGITGLCGMRPKNGAVIRPLLEVSRAEIEDYLQHLHQDFVTDSTNLEDHCTRNKIRLNLLPEMRTINPSVVSSIVETAARLSDAKRLLDVQLEEAEQRCKLQTEASEGCKINILQLQFEVAPRLLLHHILSPYGFNATQIEEINASLTGESGKLFESSEGWTLLKDRNFLFVRKKTESSLSPANAVRSLLVDLADCSLPVDVDWQQLSFHIEQKTIGDGFVIPHKKTCACLDAARLPSRLYIRRWRQGDRFTPFGMKGSKLLSDYMTDCKFSLFQKEQQAVVVDENDRILWVAGERIDDGCKITGSTEDIIQISLLS